MYDLAITCIGAMIVDGITSTITNNYFHSCLLSASYFSDFFPILVAKLV